MCCVELHNCTLSKYKMVDVTVNMQNMKSNISCEGASSFWKGSYTVHVCDTGCAKHFAV